MIVVEDLQKTFPDLRRGVVSAVSGVGFRCLPGEAFGLLGANGAGKTTTMRILSTVLKPTGGRASVAGFDVVASPGDVRRSLGFLSAGTGLYDRMSAWEHVRYFGRLYGFAGQALEQRMESVFTELRMNDFRDRLVARLSTGMRQKVSIARAIIHDPPVLIFDEPTLGLDVLVARAVLDNVARLRDEGKCILYSTHILREIEKLCDRVAVLHRGKVLDQGTLPELRERHETDDVETIFFSLVDRADRAELGAAN
jgi:sodium transport system ATP-binding protein